MRVLLSTIGSRGDVQPIVALALELRDLGEDVRVCAPPDFRAWLEGLGIEFVPIGPESAGTAKADPAAGPPTPEQRRRLIEGTVATQFDTIPAAAADCDVIVAATALQIAARSVAESMGIGYVYASYCPIALPSPRHAPPPMPGRPPSEAGADHAALWAEDARRLNDLWGPALDAHRAGLGLGPVEDVRGHMFTRQPWLAADPTLAPWPGPADSGVVQTGAWILPDERPLAADVEAFLDAGEPPVYFGFGSVRAPHDLGKSMVEAARALGRRAIVLRGWAELALPDRESDCLSIGEVNQRALFRRVAAVVHHGGAGTTTTAARAGAPQVIVPRHYDQHYFARRVTELGIGRAHEPGTATTDSLIAALDDALRPEPAQRAAAIAGRVRTDGAHVAALRLLAAERQGPC
ncbi:glycosyltransferase [Embleya sp. NPDC056575]|uniref:glycosyltransferase n=2 Tax=unclassified Embleya TaxID=2699296 RepID=UPI00368706E6